jgi:tetratricopeptide (TPR) repeat protein
MRKILLLSLALLVGSAHSQSTPTTIARSEACISRRVGSAEDVSKLGATVSVASLLISENKWHAYEHIDEALRQHNFEDALRQLDKVISTDTNPSIARCLMGALHEEQLELDKASAEYSQAILLDSRILPAYLGLARVAFLRQQWNEVIKFTDQLANLDPIAFPVGYLYKAAADFNLGELAAAESNARKFESLDTTRERPQVHLLLGDILTREHDFMGAAEEKRLFLAIVPDADDANDIRTQIRTLDDLSSRGEEGGEPH